MSDTPRTDQNICGKELDSDFAPDEVIDADFARNLERELAAAQERIAALESLLSESLAAVEEMHTDHCPAWCGYRELRAKLRAVIDAVRKEGK